MPISSVDSDTEELDSNLTNSILAVFGDTEEVRQLAANLEAAEDGTEPMYKEQAQRDLEAGSNNRFISLAQAVYSTARKNEASKAAYHFLFTLLRGFIMFGTSSMVECAAIRYGDSCQDNVTEANITLALQAPGFYNQFRHFAQHASGVFIGTRLGDTVHTAAHLLPHMPGPEDLVAGVSKHARLTN